MFFGNRGPGEPASCVYPVSFDGRGSPSIRACPGKFVASYVRSSRHHVRTPPNCQCARLVPMSSSCLKDLGCSGSDFDLDGRSSADLERGPLVGSKSRMRTHVELLVRRRPCLDQDALRQNASRPYAERLVISLATRIRVWSRARGQHSSRSTIQHDAMNQNSELRVLASHSTGYCPLRLQPSHGGPQGA